MSSSISVWKKTTYTCLRISERCRLCTSLCLLRNIFWSEPGPAGSAVIVDPSLFLTKKSPVLTITREVAPGWKIKGKAFCAMLRNQREHTKYKKSEFNTRVAQRISPSRPSCRDRVPDYKDVCGKVKQRNGEKKGTGTKCQEKIWSLSSPPHFPRRLKG